MSKGRDEFLEGTKRILADRAGWRCSFPNCGQFTLGPSNTDLDKKINNGIAAHICAAAENGPRYDPNMTPEQRKSLDNGIWMCRNHGNLIDADFSTYTVEQLKEWKVQAENFAYTMLANPSNLAPAVSSYSEQDRRVFDFLNGILPYEVIQKINDEPFGRYVPDCVIKPFHDLIYYENDPVYHFINVELEGLRTLLLQQAWCFNRHFAQQSAGAVGGYDYINISEFRRYNPDIPESYWIQISDETSKLAREFCSTAMKLREMQRNL
ncbi:hypothetical protein CMT41_07155 [Colwellia sp. MT41]|uniref:hypothetical protein n=1 Tax=Colwellia sp. MT41 TaxID=58049 RepID=UPI000717B5F2|nr:hypothetical protein [Colwellia sp. MT41]ALO34516.1 hypothetical protein CMT41_07155 [Colwellia sp. MT41]